ncbi:mitochondrial genome maintenance exonuclease 1-like [Amphiura filiformis]|uniref:mitochondrial genome maintenance exonuclease 1-like n=1 Tax=Amphiura filiformis TaxID=82378 RepID=UPI003B228A3C
MQSKNTDSNANVEGHELKLSQQATKTKLPSVTKILDKTKPWYQRLLLKKWEKKMISEMGEEGFKRYKQEMLSQGKMHHKSIEAVLHGIPEKEITVTPETAGYWKSMKHVLGDIEQVECMERRIVHPALDYLGIVDCVAKYKDQLCVIEWKTSRKPKSTLKQCYEYPLQVVAYAGALNYDPTFDHQINQALIVVAYKDGKQAHIHRMSTKDCENYWSQWLTRILQYREIIQKEEAKSKK